MYVIPEYLRHSIYRQDIVHFALTIIKYALKRKIRLTQFKRVDVPTGRGEQDMHLRPLRDHSDRCIFKAYILIGAQLQPPNLDLLALIQLRLLKR